MSQHAGAQLESDAAAVRRSDGCARTRRAATANAVVTTISVSKAAQAAAVRAGSPAELARVENSAAFSASVSAVPATEMLVTVQARPCWISAMAHTVETYASTQVGARIRNTGAAPASPSSACNKGLRIRKRSEKMSFAMVSRFFPPSVSERRISIIWRE